jgi:hypothetical protein
MTTRGFTGGDLFRLGVLVGAVVVTIAAHYFGWA